MCCVVLQGWCFYFTKSQTNEICAIFIMYFALFLFFNVYWVEFQRYCCGGGGCCCCCWLLLGGRRLLLLLLLLVAVAGVVVAAAGVVVAAASGGGGREGGRGLFGCNYN